MHDEYRVQVTVPLDAVKALLTELKAQESDGPPGARDDRIAVSHEGDHVFLYADSAEAAERARAAVEQALARGSIHGGVAVYRWHQVEERWEDASKPLPATDDELEVERERRDADEDAKSDAMGFPEWGVRIKVRTHHDARSFAKQLESEGIPVVQRWHFLLVGARDEDQAAELATRLRAEAPKGAEVTVEGDGPEAAWAVEGPYTVFGGLGV